MGKAAPRCCRGRDPFAGSATPGQAGAHHRGCGLDRLRAGACRPGLRAGEPAPAGYFRERLVPLMERNPFAAIRNNALGTQTLAAVAIDHQAEDLILVSTDEAAGPANTLFRKNGNRTSTDWTLQAASAGPRPARPQPFPT